MRLFYTNQIISTVASRAENNIGLLQFLPGERENLRSEIGAIGSDDDDRPSVFVYRTGDRRFEPFAQSRPLLRTTNRNARVIRDRKGVSVSPA